ncbi:hypothetical protein F2Q69_00052582 [Brassica cretica]|uniref:Uncharacterized protein n=1 Tax=Brassica cretica TaxID=69181 RepID=A0A8S9MUF8_BRACR|nr:hypothetical protein F2Q69_00052582 [Brassica cretica]
MTQEIIHPVFADLLTGEGIRVPQLIHYQSHQKVATGMVLLTLYRFRFSVDAHPHELKLSFVRVGPQNAKPTWSVG